MSPAAKRILVLGAACAVAPVAAACGREEPPDLVNGKRLYTERQCASCHTLARANATGTVGPNLDEAFATARRNGLGESTIAGVVREQIAIVRRNSKMPANLVTGDDARDVAAYVAYVAGVPGQDTGELAQAGRPKVSNKPIIARGGTLTIPADPTGQLAFTTTKAQASAGGVQFVMPNESQVQHNIAVKGGGLDQKGPVVGAGGSSRFSASLKPGKYVFYCSVPGHEEGGMKGDLTVK